MAYVPFDLTHPDLTDGRTVEINTIRANLAALLDMCIFGGGVVPGFAYSWSGGTADQPTLQYYKNGNYWIKLAYTWNADSTPATVVCSVSTDGGSNYDSAGTLTFTWDGDGNLTSTAWS
jgi:hypothetical protein